ncbi:MAG: hypothetical protein ACO3TI_06100 [Aquiluna sp.]
MYNKAFFDTLTNEFLEAREAQNDKVRQGITGYESQLIERTEALHLNGLWNNFEEACFCLHRRYRTQYPNCPQLHFRCTTTEFYKAVSFEVNGVERTILRFASDLEETGFKGSITGLPESQIELMTAAYRGWADYLEHRAMIKERASWAHSLQVKAGNLVDKNGNIVGSEDKDSKGKKDWLAEAVDYFKTETE